MKRNLLTSNVGLFSFTSVKLFTVVFTFFVLLGFGTVEKVTAQCIGPYQGFVSNYVKATMQADGWIFSGTANTSFSVGNARNGSYFMTLPTTGQSIVTPLLATPDKFQIYYRSSSATNNVTFRVEYSTDSTFPDTVGAPTILGPTFTTNGTTYTSTGPIDLSSLTNYYVRIRSIGYTPMTNTALTTGTGFTALSGSTSVSINSDDSMSGAIPIGFPFAYNGNVYTNVYASSNGFLSFNPSATSTPTNNLTSPSSSLLPLVAPLWDDLDGTSGTASYLTTGSVGSRIFTFEWLNWEWGAAANTPVISFQVKLYEASGRVEFVYRNEAGSLSSPSASVGITGNTVGDFYSLNTLATGAVGSKVTETSTIAVKPSTATQIYGFNGAAAALFLEDFSWTSRTSSQNLIIVPEFGNSTCNPVTVPSAASGTTYKFYDQGGSFDVYTKNQTQTMYFAPAVVGEKVQLIFKAAGLDNFSPLTTITIYNGSGTGGAVLGTITSSAIPALNTTYTSTDSSGYITVVIANTTSASALTTTHTGFDFDVKCVAPPTITNLLTATSGCVGNNLTITGTNFTASSSVAIGGVAATYVSNTSTQLIVTPGVTTTTGTVVVTNPGGLSATSIGTFTLNALPTISGQPSSGTQTLCVGGSPTALSVTAAAGSGTISTYQWYSNTSASTVGATLVATNNSSLTTDSYTPSTASAGTLYYYVVVTNSNGCIVTSSFSGAITVNAPVVITASPSTTPQTVCVGGSITALSVTATGGGLNYQWYSNTSPSNSGGTLISGATSSSYTPSNASAMAITYYYCVVSNGAPCSSSATSAVSGGITINGLPNAVTVSGAGTFCTSTTITASNSSSGTIYFQGITSGGTSTATPSTSQSVSSSGTYYFRAQSAAGCWGTEGSAVVTILSVPIAPTASAATSLAATSFSANWGSVGGATGYFLDVATDSGFTSFVPGFNNLSVGNVLTYSVTGLSPSTNYYYRVRAFNGGCSGASSGTITATTASLPYCIPPVPATTTSSVNSFSTSGGITNISNLNTGFTTGGYANYSAQSCSQYPASSIGYSITSLRTDSTDQTFFYYIWIDWNNDGDFLDTGETILATTSYQAGPFTGTIVVPSTQAAGNYRMRVSTSWIGANTSCAINTSGRGEMEDYTFTVVPVPPCAPSTPSALTTLSVTATTAIISWTDAAMTPNSIYDYYVSTSATAPTGGTTPTGTVTGANSVTLTGLTLSQTYYFWVRSNCGTPNPWIGSANFTTINQVVVNMTNGNTTSCNVKFYDSAGPGVNYANSESFIYTFYPSSASSKLKVVFNSFSTENNWDGLVIYNGNSTAAPIISSGLPAGTGSPTNCPAGSFYGNNSPGTIFSTAADGSLTFQFRSDGLVTASGWDATITCVTVPSITSFTPTGVCVGSTPTVTLTGSNFTGATSVKFNGVDATYTVVSDTSITTTLPASATTGYITVSNAQSTGTSATVFSVNPLPTAPSAGSNVSICTGSSTTLNGSSSATNTATVLSEDFNASSWPSTWSRTLNGGYSPGDFRSSAEFVSGGNTWAGNGRTGNCSYFYSYLITSGVTGDMVSPAMDLSSFNAATLTFWIYNSSGTDILRVFANNNNGAYTQVGSNYATYGSWTQITISLNAYTGTGFTSVRLRFTGTSDGFSSNIGIDDVLVTGSNSSTFVWSPSTGLSSTTILNPVANPTSTTTYTLTTSFASGCSSSSSVTVTVNPVPTVSIPTAPSNVCANSVVTATATGTATSYTWTSSVANSLYSDSLGSTLYVPLTNTTTIYVKTPSTATITVTGTNALGCSSTANVTFTVVTKTFSGGLWTPGGPPANDGSENLVFASGTFNSTGSLSACSCTVSGATVTINNGHNVSLLNGLTVTSGSMTFNSGASLLQTNNVANTGNIIYKRDSQPCFKYDYTYWSSPVASQTLIGLSPSTHWSGFFDYNPTIANWQQSNSASAMTLGKGYLIRVPDTYPVSPASPNVFTANFTGVPNNGTISLNVVHNPSSQLNLIGNPYPSALNGASFITDPTISSLLGGSLYFWTHNTNINLVTGQYTNSDYAVWNMLGGTSAASTTGSGNNAAPTGNIASGQGFFVTTLASGTGAFTNSMRTGGATNANSNFYRTTVSGATNNETASALERHRIWLDISNSNTAFKEILVGYIQDGTDGLDRLFDGELFDVGNQVVLYTKVQDKKLTIQGRGLTFTPDDTFALGYKSTIVDTYTISLSNFDGLFDHQDIYLEDKLLNVIHNLKESSYSFSSEVGTFEDRFVLRFTNQTLGVPVFSDNTVMVYKQNDALYINSGAVPMQDVAIYDITGRLIASKKAVNATQTTFVTLPMTNQVLLVQITAETGEKVLKKVQF